MGFFLSKIFPALLSPVFLTCLLCLAAGILAARRKITSVALLAFAAFLLLYAAASPLVALALTRELEKQYDEQASYPKVRAIVLLGGAMIPDLPPRRHPKVNESGDRLLEAARLWRAGLAPTLIATGGAIPFLTGYDKDEASLYARLLTELFDVPDSAILRVSGSQNTYEDALYVSRLFEKNGMRKEILLVTSAMHMPRAARLFRKQGFTVYPAPTDFRAGSEPLQHPLLQPFMMLPSEWALNETADALREYMGLAAYFLMGRL